MRLLLAALLLLWQQPQQTSIQGTVVKLGTNDPIAGALVEVRRATTPLTLLASGTSGADGKFSLPNVPAGDYRLSAQHPSGAYASTEYLQRNTQGHGALLKLAGQPLRDLQIGMAATGSISGRVIDIDGEPAVNARVMALQPAYRDGQRILSIVQALRTNDAGEYRLFWLPPGLYYLAVQPVDTRSTAFALQVISPGRLAFREDGGTPSVTRRILEDGQTVEEVRVPAYFGGGTNAGRAREVQLGSGQNVGTVDVSLANTRERAYHVRGTVTNTANGQPVTNAVVRLVPKTYQGAFTFIPNTMSDAKGSFDIAGVVPGSYWLLAVAGGQMFGGQQYGGFAGPGLRLNSPASTGTNAILSLDVGSSNLENIGLSLRPGRSIPIRATAEGGAVNFAQVSLTLVRTPDLLAMPVPESARLTADGTFTMQGVGPGDYRVDFTGLPADAFVKSLRLGSTDAADAVVHITNETDGPLDVVIGANGGSVEGSAVNARQEPIANATVVLVPEAPRRGQAFLYKVAFSDPAGKFTIQGLAPGAYRILAWESVDEGAWQNAALLQAYESRGPLVRVAESSRQNLQVTVIPQGGPQ